MPIPCRELLSHHTHCVWSACQTGLCHIASPSLLEPTASKERAREGEELRATKTGRRSSVPSINTRVRRPPGWIHLRPTTSDGATRACPMYRSLRGGGSPPRVPARRNLRGIPRCSLHPSRQPPGPRYLSDVPTVSPEVTAERPLAGRGYSGSHPCIKKGPVWWRIPSIVPVQKEEARPRRKGQAATFARCGPKKTIGCPQQKNSSAYHRRPLIPVADETLEAFAD